jgi:hypothetical protein
MRSLVLVALLAATFLLSGAFTDSGDNVGSRPAQW